MAAQMDLLSSKFCGLSILWIICCFSSFGSFAEGVCLHRGRSYANLAVWQPDSCVICTCEDPIAICENIRCTSPSCNFKKGEYLYTPKGECCPQCMMQLAPCQYQSRTTSFKIDKDSRGPAVMHNSEWNPEPCVSCVCYDGDVRCSNVTCPAIHCNPGEVKQSFPGQCCPTCVPAGRTCTYDEQLYQDGALWSPTDCMKCTCRDGRVSCYPRNCESTVCPVGQRLERHTGDCCPKCIAPVCFDDNKKQHQDGYQWMKDPCTVCVCYKGEVICRQRECGANVTCERNERKITRPGDCCPECVPNEADCSEETPLRYSGDIWNTSDCQFCLCQGGTVYCQTPVCQNQQCSKNEITMVPPGKCCDECITPPRCSHKNKFYQEGQVWHPNLCSVCVCHDGEAKCYSKNCPACPVGTIEKPVHGECCGQCVPAECDTSCRKCLPSNPAYCTECAAPGMLITEGQCTAQCPRGTYPARNDSCVACHSTCETCIEGTKFHCVSCKGGLLWKNGECVPQCGYGFFLQNGICLPCHEECNTCLGPSRAQCLSCKSSVHILFRGECVDKCGERYYFSEGQCLACQPMCLSCEPGGASCLKCEMGTYLHRGQCVSTCPLGMYPSENTVCKSCHPSCQSCDEQYDHNCTSCHGGALLGRGKVCQSACPEKQYLWEDGNCYDCDEGCQACHISVGGQIPKCMKCFDSTLVPSGGLCISECEMGRYLQNGICQSCGEHCVFCDGPAKCRKCMDPYLVLEGQCVESCSRGTYPDEHEKMCKECSQNCLECSSATECQVCGETTFLKDTQCVQKCTRGYYGNVMNRRCERNRFAPQLEIYRVFQLKEGSVSTLSTQEVMLFDQDSPVERLTVIVVKPPDNGYLIKIVKGRDQILGPDDTFSYEELKGGKIRFVHQRLAVGKGEIVLKATDGQKTSGEEVLPILAVPSSVMKITQHNKFIVVGGDITLLTTRVLNIKADTNEDSIRLLLTGVPKHGSLVQKSLGTPVIAFSLQDLKLGNIAFKHDSSSGGGQDFMILQATDGYNNLNILLDIEIRARESVMPMVVNNKVGRVTVDELMQFTSDILTVRAMDRENIKTNDIIYTLIPPLGNPKEGEIMMIVPVPSNGPGQGWEMMSDGYMGARMYRFLQRDIDEGRIWYKHKGGSSKSDMILFEVADTSTPANILKDLRFHMEIVSDETSYLAEPTVSPGIRLGLTVLENQIIPISSSNLAFEDHDTDDGNLLYSITETLGDDEGTIEHIRSPYTPVYKFTQEDINHNRIIYRPPSEDIGPEEKDVNFKFIVSDGQRKKYPERKFNIRIIPVNNLPPEFHKTYLKLAVSQGGVLPIGGSDYTMSDPDTPVAKLKFSLLNAPTLGNMEKIVDGERIILRTGDSFTYKELLSTSFQYRHDGSSSPLRDGFQISVSDGAQQSVLYADIDITKIDSSAPAIVESATCFVEVHEGDTVFIIKDHLEFVDKDDSPDMLRIVVASKVVHGSLAVGGRVLTLGQSFTQGNINREIVAYTADKEIGLEPITEVIFFNVTDSKNNLLPLQTLSVKISPVDDQVPTVHIGPEIEVEEGGRVQLTPDHFTVTDIDTPKYKLVVNIEAQPKFGYIEDTRPDEDSSERTASRKVKSFPYEDVIDGYVYYVQAEHKNIEPAWDGFLFHVTDGASQSPTSRLNITIKLENDEAPMIVSEQLFVSEGRDVTLTNASLYIIDLDSKPEDIKFTLIDPPANGYLKRKQFYLEPLSEATLILEGGTFTYDDILREVIVYEHGDVDVLVDTFSVLITDGIFNTTKTISIIIGLVDDETPRVTINRGLRVRSGSTTPIKASDLKSTDLDSEDSTLKYRVRKDPPYGKLKYIKNNIETTLSTAGTSTFTQDDIDKGFVYYTHNKDEPVGNIIFKFDVEDQEENRLIDRYFYITILDDRVPPQEVSNKELTVIEGSDARITTEFLSYTDVDSEPGNLEYTILDPPKLGHIELTQSLGIPVLQFTQSEVAANSVLYVHTSPEEVYLDKFTFTVSDGTNKVVKSFFINVSPVDDSIPVVSNMGLRVPEGVRKLITEFDLKAVDSDTQEDEIVFHIVDEPIHGTVDFNQGSDYVMTNRFTMADIYENRVSYKHDGSETIADSFTFKVSDGTNSLFAMQQDEGSPLSPLNAPQEFNIAILPTDDGSPFVTLNTGLPYLEFTDSLAYNFITSANLKSYDEDTQPNKIVYLITTQPQHGRVENIAKPGRPLSSFTQEDVNNAVIRYVLNPRVDSTQDSFTFNVMDAKPNVVTGNDFHITWSVIHFESPQINVTETDGVIKIPVIREGNLRQYSIVTCRTVPGSATSVATGSRPGQQDFVEYTGQVQFDEWQDVKMCSIIINDDSIFEGPEVFYVELALPTYSLLGSNTKTTINIYDVEDEPVIQFERADYFVNESDAYLTATVSRTGDLGTTVSAICYTTSLSAKGSTTGKLESGSDYISRGRTNTYRIVFPPGVMSASCDVRMIDDSEFEPMEQFQLNLADPSADTMIGLMSKATVTIRGPNDESKILLSQPSYFFNENNGNVEIEIYRQGTDLSHTSVVWCATKLDEPPSALPSQDYVPSSSHITFGPGQLAEKCRLTIMDDDVEPKLEGNETFLVFLSSAVGSSLAEPYVSRVTIGDKDLDVPTMYFVQDSYIVGEDEGSVVIPIYRTGDTSFGSSVICYTRQKTAVVMMDYDERVFTDDSRIIFLPGEKIKNCTVGIVNDVTFEDEETFFVRLADPEGPEHFGAKLGILNKTTITITDHEDVPKVQFEEPAYSIMEPTMEDQINTLTIKIIRTGDISKPVSVRSSTRDGSAISGIDYNARSAVITFEPGEREKEFPVDILYNGDIEWHESLSVVLGPDAPTGAVFGTHKTTTITILDIEVSGSLVLPAPPVVVSLLHYDDADVGIKIDPSPGYPLVCVSPCDLHYPTYSVTHTLCEESGINQSTVAYRWEVAMPADADGSRSPFVQVSDKTVFTSVDKKVLDSIYFRSSFRVRCVAQPIHNNGNPGVPLKSSPVTIGRDNGICRSTMFSGNPFGFQAQSFMANLDYKGPDDVKHPNTIHISIEVPHQDGMLPLLSTFPLHNLRFLLSEPIYRQQHVCSNIITLGERLHIVDGGFLTEWDDYSGFVPVPGQHFPYQFDPALREHKTIMLYKHLNLKSCTWKFEAWYHMTDLVDICGGKVISDFQVKDQSKTYLTVRVPLYVSYLYATAPIGWGSLEHRTEMEFSFYYDTILWKDGLETEGKLGGRLQVMKIMIGEDGKLVIDFKTQAKFRGLYVLEHHTLPDHSSRIIPPSTISVAFDLALLWSQHTYDSPHQLWRATSKYNLKDYTGEYIIELIPCTVKSTQRYTSTDEFIPCTAQDLQRFEVPIAFQQTNRPVPLEYSLNTEFQLTNNLQTFLIDPSAIDAEFDDLDFNGAFSKGQKIYGRVLWSPEQDLKKAYKLSVEKVFLCTGRDGYIPTYDPTGETYNEGPQFGCMQATDNLKHRFLILDRGDRDMENRLFNGVKFGAQLASDNVEYTDLLDIPGVDGFVMDVDPLYKVDPGHKWYIQVVYVIISSDSFHRFRRSAISTISKREAKKYSPENDLFAKKNGTNMKQLNLITSSFENSSSNTFPTVAVVVPLFVVMTLLLGIILGVLLYKRKHRVKRKNSVVCNNLETNVVTRVRISTCSANNFSECNQMTKLDNRQNKKNLEVRIKDTNIKNEKRKNINTGTEV